MAVDVEGLTFDDLTLTEAVRETLSLVGPGGYVVTPNLDHLQRCRREPGLRDLYNRASLTLADGAPVVWLARLRGHRLKRVTGADLLPRVCSAAAQRGLRVAVIGMPSADSAQNLEVNLPKLFSGLTARVVSPPMGFEEDPGQLAGLDAHLAAFAPDVVFACLGSPKQERWILRTRPLLPDAVFIGAGASALFLTGELPRAPRWMRRVGLEWLFRLRTEPRRLTRRYAGNGVFIIGAIARQLRKGSREANR